MVNVEKFELLDLNDLVFGQPRVNTMGGQSVPVTMNGEKLRIQLPKCDLPFGLNNWNERYSADLSLKNESITNFMTSFDSHMVNVATDNCKQWFNKTLSNETVSELYKPCVKKSDKYAPIMRYKFIPQECSVFDNNRNAVSHKCIVKGCSVVAIAELIGLYFVAKEFGATWKVIQLKVWQPPVSSLKEYAFIDEDDEDIEPV